MCRYRRLLGQNVLWMPGTDHAGIATQNVVERDLAAKGQTRDMLGREEFIEEVWKWREKSGGAIINQLKRLGLPVTGTVNGLPWMKGFPMRSAKCL